MEPLEHVDDVMVGEEVEQTINEGQLADLPQGHPARLRRVGTRDWLS